jgi:hypothetical protein
MTRVPEFLKGRARCRRIDYRTMFKRHLGNGLQLASIDVAKLRQFFITSVEGSCLFKEHISDRLELCNFSAERLPFFGQWNQLALILLPKVVQSFRHRPTKIYSRFIRSC